MEFLLAFVVTGLAACGGWLVWGIGRQWSRWSRQRHERLLARARADADIRQAEVQANAREQQLANEIYQDFARRNPPPDDSVRRHPPP